MWNVFGNADDRLRVVAAPAVSFDGRTEVFGLAADDTIWNNAQTAGGWSGWQQFGAPDDRLRTLEVQRSGDGRLEAFGTAADDTIWVNYQTVVGGGWSGWQQFGAPDDRLRVVAPAVNSDGRTEVFGLAADDTIWNNAQTAGGWSGWQQFGAPDDRLRTLAVGVNADGRLEVAGTAGNETIWRATQLLQSGPWSPWVEFRPPEDRLRQVAMFLAADGRLHAFGTASDDSIWFDSQSAPGRWVTVPLPLPTIFTGTSTLTTTFAKAPGPFTSPVTIGVTFNSSRNHFDITSFPPITTDPFDTGVGLNTTTVSFTGGTQGDFVPANGALDIKEVNLFFDQSLDLPLYVEDSAVMIPLSTGGAGGSPLNPLTGRVMLVGTGRFRGGLLGGSSCTLVLAGTFSPIP